MNAIWTVAGSGDTGFAFFSLAPKTGGEGEKKSRDRRSRNNVVTAGDIPGGCLNTYGLRLLEASVLRNCPVDAQAPLP